MEAHPYILAWAFTVSINKEWEHIHTFLCGPSLFPGTKNERTSIHFCQGLHCFQEQRMEEAHPYILARAFTVSRNKEWRKHIHTFLPGPSLIPGAKNGSTFIHSFQAFTNSWNKVRKKHIYTFLPGPSLIPGIKNGSRSIHSCLAFTEKNGSTSIHSCQCFHCFQEKKGSTSIHSCQGLHCFQEQRMEAHPGKSLH